VTIYLKIINVQIYFDFQVGNQSPCKIPYLSIAGYVGKIKNSFNNRWGYLINLYPSE
jgi:hypothetical protein